FKGNHQVAGERPGLAGQILDVFQLQAYFFKSFTTDCFFKGFSDLYKASNQAIHLTVLVACIFGQQYFILTSGNNRNDTRLNPGVLTIMTSRTDHGMFCGMSFSRCAAVTAEFVVTAPLQ